jgi:RES domain-containing protein
LKFAGLAYRAHDPRWSYKPVSGDGAAIRGGRFNPKGVPALYLSLDPMTAVNEASNGLSHWFDPCLLCSYMVECDDIIDLSKPATRKKAGVLLRDMKCKWADIFDLGVYPPSWRIADRLIAAGAAGIVTPSFALGARRDAKNLVLWSWSDSLPHKVTVFDPSGKLPKDQLSWS